MIQTETAYCVLCGASAISVPIAYGWDFEYGTTREEHQLDLCCGCCTIFIKDRPAEAEMGRIYPSDYYSFNESSKRPSITDYIRTRLELAKARRYSRLMGQGKRNIIDIGCGDGRLLDILKQHDRSWRCSGIDIDWKAAIVARNKGHDCHPGNIENDELHWLPGSFDLALLHQVIEHTRDPRRVLQRIAQLLRKGGYVSIETTDVKSLDFRLFGQRYWGGYHIPRHFYVFNKQSLRKLLEQEGFEVVRIASILSPVFWIHSVHNWLVDTEWGWWAARFFHYRNPILLAAATTIELVQTTVFRQSSNMQVIARKI
jgi:SAM-dependent methyltransferase